MIDCAWRQIMENNKPMRLVKLFISIPVVSFLLSAAYADDWPQWQGPDRNAISKERGLLKEWPNEGPPLAWKISGLGGGDSAPSISGGRIFAMSNRGDEEVVWAVSEKDGKELWTARVGPAYQQQMPQGKEGPGCTPTVDGELLYAEGLGGIVACLRVTDGKIIWQRSLQEDFGGSPPTWSYRESPLIDGNKVICTPGGEEATLVALDKLTGKTIWKSVVPGSPKAAYASAIAIDFEGQRQYVQFTQKAIVGITAADGKFLWQYARCANSHGINCSTPVYQDGKVFAASAYGAGGGLVKLAKDEDGGVKAEEIYFSRKMQNHHGGMVVLDGSLYGANGGNEGGALVCLDFQSGNVLWDERDDADHRAPKGSIALADGRVYYRTERGPMLLIEPSPKEYLERGRFDPPDRSKLPAWAHPVIANGKLYLRDQDVMLCYNVKAP
ncbi:MAG TPA: PQQ-binding-like beta-propeller repeat protein [Patescibacteria group bacterium]|nr:PQQ-binding-like beta-propeller repeat protein [Patescibacteria group bacterium]